jgi:DNA polymerase III subunit gamma/tau
MADEKYLVLARKWRPQRFEDVVGQEHITRTIQNSIASGRIGHAFLFIGCRGIGKTTTARVLAKALNCQASDKPTPNPCDECDACASIAAGTNIDVIEIDGASNRGIDDARQLRENVRFSPSQSRYKIYIIDEVHQLTNEAFNALLKTIEEPPPHAVFILATTEAHKVPATIVSRCQRYDFRRVGMERLTELLQRILDKEGVQATTEALYAIARAGDGSIRDSESILEQIISYCDGEISFQDVFDVLGLVDWKLLHDLCAAMLEKDVARLLKIVDEVVVCGKDLSVFVQDILHYFRNLLVCKTADPKGLLPVTDEELEVLKAQAAQFSLTGIIRLVEQFAELAKDFDSQIAQRIALETMLIRVSKVAVEMSVDEVLEKLVQLGAGGVGAPSTPVPAPAESPSPRSLGAASAVAEAPEAPAAPKKPRKPKQSAPRKAVMTDANAKDVWKRISQTASEKNLNLGVALGGAQDLVVDGDTLQLQFTEDQGAWRSAAEKSENRELVEGLLRQHTSNVSRLATVMCEKPAEEDAARAPVAQHGASVDPEAVRAALEEPLVAKIVDVFKGRVVDVRESQPTEPAE